MHTEMSDAQTNENREARTRRPLVLALWVFFGGVFFVNEQNFQMLRGEATLSPREYRENRYTSDVDDAEENIEQGSTLRRIAFPMVGLLGLLLLVTGNKPTNYHPLLLLAGLLYAWCAMSVAWSVSPGLSIKRFVVFSACVAAIIGLAKAVTLRELCWVSALTAASLVGFAFAWELKLGLFEPWEGIYRFAGAVHPNTEASYCALLTLALFGLTMMQGRLNAGFVLAMLCSVGLLLLTKSRSSLLGVVFAMFITWLLTVRAEKRALGLFMAPLAAIAVGIALALSTAGSSQLQSAAALGREADGGANTVGGLNGRVPLWGWCLEPFMESPVLGYGFDAFWTPKRMQAATEDLEWTIPNAHNALLDVGLNLGFVGGGMFALLSLAVITLAAKKLSATKDPTLCFPVAAGLFAISNACFESTYSQPTGTDSFLVFAALTMAVLMPSQRQVDQGDDPASRSQSRGVPLTSGSRRPLAAPPAGWGRPAGKGPCGNRG